MYQKSKYQTSRFKRNIKNVLKITFCVIYFAVTSIVITNVFKFVFDLKGSFIYAIAISGFSFVLMDIICSILEDFIRKIYKLASNKKEKKRKAKEKIQQQKDEEIKQIQKFIQERNDYKNEIDKIEENSTSFEQKILLLLDEEMLPENVKDGLKSTCEQMNDILSIIKGDTKKYYPIRHTFRTYFPKFQELTYNFIDIACEKGLKGENIAEFERLIAEFKKYLDFVKSSTNSADRLRLNIGIESLIQSIESERKKGDN